MVSATFSSWHATWGSACIEGFGVLNLTQAHSSKLTSSAWMLAGMQQGFRKSGSQTWMLSETKLVSWTASLQAPLERQAKRKLWPASCILTICLCKLWSSYS